MTSLHIEPAGALARYIALRRTHLGMTIEQLADGAGIDRMLMSRFEKGYVSTKAVMEDPDRLRRIADALDVRMYDLLRVMGYADEEPHQHEAMTPNELFFNLTKMIDAMDIDDLTRRFLHSNTVMMRRTLELEQKEAARASNE